MQLLEEILILHRELGEKLAALCTPRDAKQAKQAVCQSAPLNPTRADQVAERTLALLQGLRENPDARYDCQVMPEWNRLTISRYLKRAKAAGYVEADSRTLTPKGLEHLAKNQGNQ